MENSSVKIEKIKLKDLYTFTIGALEKPAYVNVLPISPVRAFSQSQNPYGHPDDIVLLVAYYKDRCVGYLGMMPGLFKYSGQLSKIYYVTTFFVSHEVRCKGIGSCILKELKHLNIDIVSTGMTKSAIRAFEKALFKNLGALVYYQLQAGRIFSLSSLFADMDTFIEKNWPKFTGFVSLLKKTEIFLSGFLKRIFYYIVSRGLNKTGPKFRYKEVNQINQDVIKLRDVSPSVSGFYRGIESVNWMLKHKWILSSQDGDNRIVNYHFSSVRSFFKYVALEIYSHDMKNVEGFIILSISHKNSKTIIKMLDFFLQNSADIDIFGFLVLKYAQQYLADLIEYPSDLTEYFKKINLLRPFMKKRKRLYLFHTENDESLFASQIDKIELNYCDSDIPFV